MGRIKHICETCLYWDRDHAHQTIDGSKVYARCFMTIYSRYSTEKCVLWIKKLKS